MLSEIIPILDVRKANNILKEKIKNEDISIPEGIEEIDIRYLEEDYKSAIEGKNRFEDKAKTIIAALTIAITLILNLSKIIDTIAVKFNFTAIEIFVFILALLAIIYMLMAGLMSIQVLIKENVVYIVPVTERKNQDKEKLYIITQKNVNQNLVRNNIIFSAYRSIRNSVICLVVLFVIAVFPIQVLDNNEMSSKNIFSYENICFEEDAVKWIIDNAKEDINFEKIIEQYDKDVFNSAIQKIYDEKNGVLVILKKNDDFYIIENIISDIEEME